MTHHRIHENADITNVSRRAVFKGLVGGGGLILAAQFPLLRHALAYPTGADAMPNGVVSDPRIFVAIANNGIVSIVAARAEMGTGAARTTLPMIVADELDADWARVRIVQSPGDEKKYGNQDTDGSRSVRHFLQPMRQCGAAARMMLEAAAAKRWGVETAEVEAQHHEVVHRASGRKLGYGDLAEEAAAMPVPAADQIRLKEPAAFRYIGKGNTPVVDLLDITTGDAIYGQDVRLGGMKFAVIARPPVVGGKVASFDGSEALKVPGVEKVVQIASTPAPAKFAPLGGVAVIAINTWAALKGRDALKITWDDGPNKSYDSKAYKALLEEEVRKPGKMERNQGDVETALASAARIVTGEYYAPHLAHATMEPPAALAQRDGDKWQIWAPVQSPGGARDDVAQALGVKPEDVTMNCTLLGGGFGRKSKCDFAIEAALLSRELGGAPVKVVWTREDDIRHGFYHTVTADRFEAGLDASNKVVAWRHRSAAPTFMANFMPDPKAPSGIELGMGWVDTPFDIPNIRMESGAAQAHARIGWFRSVNNVMHAWSIQSFIAELAHELKKDPKDFLLEMIGPARIVDPRKQVTTELWDYGEPFDTYPIDTGRLRRVAELAAERAGWGRQLPKGRGLGIAAHRSFVSYIATVVEVVVDDKGNFSVPRVETAVDCGFCVDPERVRSQIEGAAVMGLTLAKYGDITFKDGRVEQSNFHDFPLVRIDESPTQTNVHIVPHGIEVPASGVGEPGVPPFAPALCNAIFAATGKRIRRLPIGNQNPCLGLEAATPAVRSRYPRGRLTAASFFAARLASPELSALRPRYLPDLGTRWTRALERARNGPPAGARPRQAHDSCKPLFYLFAGVCVASAFMVIAAKNPVHSVLFLILAFVNASGLFVLLGAEFLAMILVVVYVGAVAVLFLFVVMMLDVDFAELRQGFLQYLPIGALVGIVFLVELLLVLGGWAIGPGVLRTITEPIPPPETITNTEALGLVLYTRYIYFFQAAGIILLIAMIGAIVLTLHHRPRVKRQKVTEQVARTRDTAIEVRKVRPGQGVSGAMAVTLGHYLSVSAILFTLGMLGIFLNRKNVIVILMSIELILLAVNINFVAFSAYLGDLVGQVFALLVLTVAAAEAAIGLAILVAFYRNRGSIAVEDVNLMKG